MTGADANCSGKAQYFEHSAGGELLRTWGDTTYPVEYGYDDYGRRTTMKTFRGGTGWTGSTWPTGSTGMADTTTWVYEEATGLLVEKRYADHTTQAPRNILYTYTTAGKLLTRTWARSSGGSHLATTYGYDASTGDLTSVDYADATPDV